MRNLMRIVAIGLVMGLAASPALLAQADLSKYIALGDSLTAGFASGGLMVNYQKDAYPAILARQFGMASFQQPTVSDPGIPSVMILQALRLTSQGVSPVIVPKSASTGAPTNATLQGPYHNLGIPGAKVNDLLTKTGDIRRLAAGQSTEATVMYDLILRDNTTTAIQQAIGAAGTFYTVWIGNNDVLGAVTTGVALDGVTLTPVAAFQTQYATLLGALKQNRPNARIVVANIPAVTAIPFLTTIKPYLINPANGSHIPLIGEQGLLTENDYLTLAASSLIAQGIGVPAAAGGTGRPLPEGSFDPATGTLTPGVILRAAEVAAIKARHAELNTVIASVASQMGAKVFDANSLFASILANGYVVGGVKLTASFLTGGLFSYDGVHLQNLGNAVLANEMIKFINARFGTAVPEVNLRSYLMGAAATTSVLAGSTQFSMAAWQNLLAVTVPELAAGAKLPGPAGATAAGAGGSRAE
jgi:hypothetical protein